VIYVFDTSAFIVLKHFYRDTFKSLWAGLEELAAEGSLVSTREVFNELQNYNDVDFIQDWAKEHKKIYTIPTNAELAFVRQILAIRHFQTLIGGKELLKGTPVADPFVIAAARIKKGSVVTQEKLKRNAAKVPNICAHFLIPCVDLGGFMEQQGWSF